MNAHTIIAIDGVEGQRPNPQFYGGVNRPVLVYVELCMGHNVDGVVKNKNHRYMIIERVEGHEDRHVSKEYASGLDDIISYGVKSGTDVTGLIVESVDQRAKDRHGKLASACITHGLCDGCYEVGYKLASKQEPVVPVPQTQGTAQVVRMSRSLIQRLKE